MPLDKLEGEGVHNLRRLIHAAVPNPCTWKHVACAAVRFNILTGCSSSACALQFFLCRQN